MNAFLYISALLLILTISVTGNCKNFQIHKIQINSIFLKGLKQVKGVDSHLFVGHSLDRRFAFNETDLLIDTQNVIQGRLRRHFHEIFKFDNKRHSHQFLSMDEEAEPGVATATPIASTAVLEKTVKKRHSHQFMSMDEEEESKKH